MALTIDSILNADLPDIDQQILLNKGMQPGKIIVQCYATGKVNIYGEAHRIHKTRGFTIKRKDGSVREVPPSNRVVDDPREKEACLKAQILADHYAAQVEKNWPCYNDAENERETYKITEDPNRAVLIDHVLGKLKAKECKDPRVLAMQAKAVEYREWLLAVAKVAHDKMEDQFVMDQESVIMSKELRIAKAREMAREQVRAAADGVKGRKQATPSTT